MARNIGTTVVDINSSEEVIVCADILAQDFDSHANVIKSLVDSLTDEANAAGGGVNDALTDALMEVKNAILNTETGIKGLAQQLDTNLGFKINMDSQKYQGLVDEMRSNSKKQGKISGKE